MENTVETLAALLGATLQRLPEAAAPEQSAVSHLATAVHRVHAANTANYTRWMGRLGLKPRVPPTSASAQLHQLVLWYLIWGEAANLRLLPECLCLVLYCASNALNFEASNSEGGEAAAQRAEGGLAEVTSEAGFAEKRLGLGLGLGLG